MKVTAEGMETPTQAEQLKALQCGDIQAYGFHRPLQPKCWKRLLLGAPPAEFSHASAGLRVARRLSSTGAKMGSVMAPAALAMRQRRRCQLHLTVPRFWTGCGFSRANQHARTVGGASPTIRPAKFPVGPMHEVHPHV